VKTSTFNRPGFTLTEALVVIVIIGVLVGLSLPAMQNMRELSRRSNCEQNLVRLSLALSAYSVDHGHYPTGTIDQSTPIRSIPKGYHHNWIAALLPNLGESTVAAAIDPNASVYAPTNENARRMQLGFLLCPSASDLQTNTTCYAGIHASTEVPITAENDGMFKLNTNVTESEIRDGLGHTIFLAEKLSRAEEDLGWISGTRSSLRNVGDGINGDRKRIRGLSDLKTSMPDTYVGGIASDHPGGAYLLLGSGEYQFRSNSMDQQLLRQMTAIADGEVMQEDRDEILTDSDEPND
jgi:prepilin-type N-terminal cleavage/methylation domain-containing protein